MAHTHRILILSDDPEQRDRWRAALGPRVDVGTDLQMMLAASGVPDLIVTDTLPITEPLSEIATLVAAGEVGVMGIGTEGLADVVLPADCSNRELRLACRLLVEIARLRCRLAEEVRGQRALRKMADRDPLTGLANRRKWDRELVTRLEGLQRADTRIALGLVLLDVDHFKRLNDQLGHVVGDTTLQRIAHKLAANLAEQHLAARLGGDEFGILLSGVFPADVPEVADVLRRSLELKVEDAPERFPPVTVSAGVVVLMSTTPLARPRDALEAADQALRLAKSQGRNQTSTASLPLQS